MNLKKGISSILVLGILTTGVSLSSQQVKANTSYSVKANSNNLFKKGNEKLKKASNLVRNFEKKPNVRNHRDAQRAVNILHPDYKKYQKSLQKRIDRALVKMNTK